MIRMKASLVKKLDKIFSEYIRKKYTKNGYGRCYTCKIIKPYEELDAGHYITRNNKNTRWNEKNVKIQCRKCNRFLSGNTDEFALALVEEYGEDILKELNKDKWIPKKIDDLEIIGMIEYYNERIKVFHI